MVHNSFIKNDMQVRGVLDTSFLGQVDSEVIVNLFVKHLTDYQKDSNAALKALRATLEELYGTGPEFFHPQGVAIAVGVQ
ncbi:hypothetical protein DJ031_05960 [bacterium endosymbiont of Escarpia laminata]|nr:MAG: hypothetical protein DJ031_05960 [bacterium endosymbiont of Escarpia laminata]